MQKHHGAQFGLLVIIVISIFSTASCDDKSSQQGTPRNPDTTAPTPDDKTSQSDDPKESQSGSITYTGSSSGSASPNPSNPLSQVESQCGLPNGFLTATQTKPLLEKNFKSAPVKTGYVKAYVTFILHFVSTMSQGTSTTDTTVEGSYAKTIKSSLDKQVKGDVVTTGLAPQDIIKLGQTPGWENIICTLIATKKIETKQEDNTSVIEFDPPIPSAFSPFAPADRITAEKPEREFKDITAKIVSTNNKKLKKKTELKGWVHVRKADPKFSGTDGKGNAISIAADEAYTIESLFESNELTSLIGIQPVITYYIDSTKKDIVGVVIDSKNSLLKNFIVFQ